MKQILPKVSFWSGILLLLLGVYLYLSFWFIQYGIILLIIGGFFILLSHKNWKIKLLLIGIPYAFVAITFYMSFTTPEIFLIPKGYKGPVYVIFNQENGVKKEFEGHKRLYKIPTNGILFTQFKNEEGFMNQEYFYVDSLGKRHRLGVLDTRDFNEEWTTKRNPKEPPRDSLAVFNPGTMGTYGNSGASNSFIYSELLVGTYNNVRQFEDFKPEYIDSLRKVLLPHSR